MANYIISNDSVRIVPESSINITQKLPLGTYTVEAMPVTGELYLKKTDNFIKPDKIYGEANEQSDRIIRTFEDRANNTGVILDGVKGSGKTFIAKIISWKLYKKESFGLGGNNNLQCNTDGGLFSSRLGYDSEKLAR